MNRNILIVLAGGFVIAILVAVLVQAGFKEKKTETAQKKTEILVAARDLPIGTNLGEADVKWQEWPESMVFASAIQRTDNKSAKDALAGKMKQRALTGEPMSRAMVVDAEKGNMLAATLRDGYRAVGIPVRIETLAGGLIGIGDFVDVVMTYRLTRTGDSPIARKFASETILENIRVLGVDKQSVAQDLPEDSKTKAKTKQTVTLEVTPDGAEKIALASDMGEITLSLRPLGDTNQIAGDKATTDVGLSKVMGQMVGGTGGGQMRVYNGAEVQNIVASGSVNNQIGRDEGVPDVTDPQDEIGSDVTPPEEVLDAVRQGIADGISQGMTGMTGRNE